MLKRILACGLAAALACSLFTGCRAPALEDTNDSSYTATVPAEAEKDVISYLTNGAISSEDTVMTVNGVEVPASAYFYQLTYLAGYLSYYYQPEDDSDTFSLDKEYNGKTYADYLMEQTQESIVSTALSIQKGQEEKLTLTEDTQNQLDTLDQEMDANTLLYYTTTPNGMKFLYTGSDYNTQLRDALFAKGGKYEPTKQTLKDYREDNVLAAKHILLMTTGKSDEEKAEIKKTIQGYLDAILADDDQASAFDQYMNEHSEDTGLAENPDGYTFLPGDMVAEFEDAVTSLKVGQVDPEVVETSYGYHLIMRIEPDMDAIDDDTLQERYEDEIYHSVVHEWMDAADVETSKALDNLDVNAYYQKLTRLQEIVQAIAQAEAQDAASSTGSAAGSAQ